MKLTIRKFQELYSISQIETDELSKSCLLVQCLTGKSEEEVNAMSLSKYNKLCTKINNSFESLHSQNNKRKPRQFIWIKRRPFMLNYDLAKPPMNSGRYVEIATYSEDIIGNLHRIMATMCTPLKLTWKGFKQVKLESSAHEKLSQEMLNMDFYDAYHSAVFFWAVFSKSIQNFNIYFKSITDGQVVMEEVLKNLESHMDGCSMPNWYLTLKESA
jgi:hypothetical protein